MRLHHHRPKRYNGEARLDACRSTVPVTAHDVMGKTIGGYARDLACSIDDPFKYLQFDRHMRGINVSAMIASCTAFIYKLVTNKLRSSRQQSSQDVARRVSTIPR